MPKKSLLEGIELDDETIDEGIDKAREFLDKNRPAIKAGIRSIEHDVLKTGRALFDYLTADETEEKPAESNVYQLKP